MEKLDSWLEADWQWKQIQERWLCVKVLLSGMKSSFCDSKKAAVERVHVQSSPQTKQDRHTHPLDPGSNPGNSYALGHDNQLDSNTLAAFWTCRSCTDGTEDVKQGTQGSWVAQDTHGARKESVEADPEAETAKVFRTKKEKNPIIFWSGVDSLQHVGGGAQVEILTGTSIPTII